MDEVMESPTPALDQIMAARFSEDADLPSAEADNEAITPEVYRAAAVEAYHILGESLSELGSMYLLLGSMLAGSDALD